MPMITLANFTAAGFYLAALCYLLLCLNQRQSARGVWLWSLTALALVCHGLGVQGTVLVPGGINASIFQLPTLFFWIINLIVLVSSLRKPLHNLFVFLFPLSIVAIAAAQFSSDQALLLSPAVGHVMLAMLASGVLTIATLQGLLLAYQDYQLKHKHTTGLVRLLPPLQTMEALMFELVWVGELLLTTLIVSGLFILEDVFAQQQAHTLVFSLLAWGLYAVLLWGRHWRGWRGGLAVRWVLGGFAALLLAYMGTQLVYQVIL